MAGTYDTKCWDLACHFLADVPHATDDDRAQLARDLQQTAEDAISDLEPEDCCPGCGACPGFTGADCDETCEWATTGGGAA